MDLYRDIVALEAAALEAAAERRHAQAVREHKRALTLARRLENPRLTAALSNRLGRALEAWGDVQDAVVAYELGFKALAGDASLNIEKELRSLGTVSKEFIAADAAVPDLYSEEAARDLDAEQKDPALPVVLLINIGNAYLRQPQPGPALNAYQLALARPEMADAPRLRAYALANSGEILRQRGDDEGAEESLGKALVLLEANAPPAEKRRSLALLAGIYRDRGDGARALETYQSALKLYAEAGDAAGEGRTLAGLARLYVKLERTGEARGAYARARELARGAGDRDTLWHAAWGLGHCLRLAGELEEAAALLRESLDLILARQSDLRTDEGKVTFLESVQDVFDQLVGVYVEMAERGDADGYGRALEVAEEARAQALLDIMDGRERVRRRKSKPGARPRPLSFSPVSQMAPAVSSDFSAQGPWDDDSTEAFAEDDPLDEAAAETAPPAAPPLARLVFHVMTEQTIAFAVTADGLVRAKVVRLGRAAWAERVSRVRRALSVDDAARGMLRNARADDRQAAEEEATDPRDLLRELYEQLVAGLEPALPDAGTPLVIEPHAALWLLPFAALVLPDGTYLSGKWPLLHAPAWKALRQIQLEPDYGEPAAMKALLVGNPTMPEVRTPGGEELRLDALPGAEEEVRQIAGLIPAERLTIKVGAEADRASVEGLLERHGILHFATHGWADARDPLGSFVVLAEAGDGDGPLLTARRVMDKTVAADLVTLSACQTGLGQVSGEGVIGLSRAFIVAGARATLVSLWNVSDRATAKMMSAFYRHYLELDDKAVALERAARELRDTPEFAGPRYWAPFIVVGAAR